MNRNVSETARRLKCIEELFKESSKDHLDKLVFFLLTINGIKGEAIF